MNAIQASTKSRKMKQRALDLRTELWPGTDEGHLWDLKKSKGFAQMPRTMVYVMNIIDSLTSGKPAGRTYLPIWCRLFEVGIVELASEKAMAFESGFTGERAVDTWRQRMRQLKALGFIDYKPGKDHDFQWVLVFNPHHVLLQLGNQIQEKHRAAWKDRASEIGAVDLSLPAPPPPPAVDATLGA